MIVSVRQWPVVRFLPWATKDAGSMSHQEREVKAKKASIFDVWQNTLESQVDMVLRVKN
jgi:hypothetical protein